MRTEIESTKIEDTANCGAESGKKVWFEGDIVGLQIQSRRNDDSMLFRIVNPKAICYGFLIHTPADSYNSRACM